MARIILIPFRLPWLAMLAALAWGADPAFQPSPPYHAVFFYPWYPQWTDRGHRPPENWFSNYLPDPNPCAFDPAGELYSSTDDKILYWQLRKMAEARIEIAIASWWGRTHKTDAALRHILGDVMNRADNPYPNLRWALYYEKESLGDPSVEELVDDLNHIRETFASKPSHLKIGGRPVIFVYADGNDRAGMAARWAEARQRTNFYVVLKVYSGYRQDPNQPDSWHQYAPANRIDRQTPYSYMVSPGFWLDGEAVRLPRDLADFRKAVQEMVAAPVPWKFIQTWNEWGEGTAVEPGDQVIQSRSGKAELDPAGVPFKNLYIDALRELLPPLEQGTGAQDQTGRVRNAASLLAGAVAPGELVAITTDADSIRIDCDSAPVLRRKDDVAIVRIPAAARDKAYVRIDAGLEWWMLPVAASAPGLFTADLSGRGPAAALNQDGSLNSEANPALAGSVISLFATGIGAGESVAVEIGGAEAEVLFAGESEGLFQINARVPEKLAGGPAAVLVRAASAQSQGEVTLHVQNVASAIRRASPSPAASRSGNPGQPFYQYQRRRAPRVRGWTSLVPTNTDWKL